MGRGRKRRLKHFKQRAEAFLDQFPLSHEVVERDSRDVQTGIGQHARLVRKNVVHHLLKAIKLQKLLLEAIQRKEINPNHYALVEVHSVVDERIGARGVQEYFSKPSVSALWKYFNKKGPNPRWSPKARKTDPLLCKSFLNQNPSITKEEITKAYFELIKDANRFYIPHFIDAASSNVIVLGKSRDGKIRLAIVDA